MTKRGRKRDPARLQHDTTLFAIIRSGEQTLQGLASNDQKLIQLIEEAREAGIEPGLLVFGGKEVPSFESAREAAAWLADEWDVDPDELWDRYMKLKRAHKSIAAAEDVPEYVRKRL